jgi:hypothetical protein
MNNHSELMNRRIHASELHRMQENSAELSELRNLPNLTSRGQLFSHGLSKVVVTSIDDAEMSAYHRVF